MSIIVIDYGMSNLGSITNALIECGGEDVVVSEDPKQIKKASHIILPGVGSFKDGIDNLVARGLKKAIVEAVTKDKIPLLGICLGMQLLASKGYEGGEIEGLGLIAGTVEKLRPTNRDERIPHVGWNEVYPIYGNSLFANIQPGTDFYFVHSYQFIPTDKKTILSTTPYCGDFVSGVVKENIFGTQFHPEKSQRPGFQLLTNFINL